MGCGCGVERDEKLCIEPISSPYYMTTDARNSPIATITRGFTRGLSLAQNFLAEDQTVDSCMSCADPDKTKHFLDCSHGLCKNCCKTQLKELIRKGQRGNLEFFCKICKVNKALSKSYKDNSVFISY